MPAGLGRAIHPEQSPQRPQRPEGPPNLKHTADTSISLPFPHSLYGTSFSTANVTSNGQLDFQATDTAFSNTCLPDTTANYAIFPHWDDLRTDMNGTVPSGIFTSTSGV